MPASVWLRPLIIAAVIALLAGILGLLLNQPRLAPIALFISELLAIFAAIAWNTPKLPLFSETRPLSVAAAEATTATPNAASDDRSNSEMAATESSQEDAA